MILPQLGSSPYAAVLTRGEFATFKATFFEASCELNPETLILMSLVAPSPSKTNFSDNSLNTSKKLFLIFL